MWYGPMSYNSNCFRLMVSFRCGMGSFYQQGALQAGDHLIIVWGMFAWHGLDLLVYGVTFFNC